MTPVARRKARAIAEARDKARKAERDGRRIVNTSKKKGRR